MKAIYNIRQVFHRNSPKNVMDEKFEVTAEISAESAPEALRIFNAEDPAEPCPSMGEKTSDEKSEYEIIRDLMGFVQDGSATSVCLSQDDATSEYIVTVGKTTYWGSSLKAALKQAQEITIHSTDGE